MMSWSRVSSSDASKPYVKPPMRMVLARKVPRYQAASRRPRAWLTRSPHFEDITRAADGVNQLGLEAFVNLVAKPRHEHVDDVRAGIEGVSPDVREDHRLREDAAGMAHQVFD